MDQFVFFKVIIFIFSLLGYGSLFHFWLKIEKYYLPIFTFVFISLFTFLGGIFNILEIMVYLLVLVGNIVFLVIIYQRRKINIFIYLNGFDYLFYGCSFLFIRFLFSSKFEHYDNFSHWGIVVKYILSNDHFPLKNTALIEFYNYPLGTASWLYYVCKFLGNGQNIMLIAQSLLIFGALYSLFDLIKERKRFLLYIILACGLAMLSIFNLTIRINNLLVDFILPIFTLSSWVIIYRYHHDLKKLAILLIPILNFLVIIKNTGIIFALFALMYLFYQLKGNKKDFFKVLLITIGSFVSLIIWQIYLKLVFVDVINKFDLNNINSSDLNIKTKLEIVKLFLLNVFKIDSRYFLGFVIFLLVSIISCIFVRLFLNKRWQLEKVCLALIIMVVFYLFGILLLYIFMMPSAEAIVLAGFERYVLSIIVLYIGGLVLCFVSDVEASFYVKKIEGDGFRAFYSPQTKAIYQKSLVFAFLLTVLILSSEYNGLMYNKVNYENSLPDKVEKILHDQWYFDQEENSNKYLVYGHDEDQIMSNGYFKYVVRYYLFASKVDTVCVFYEDNFLNLIKDYDYLIIIDHDFQQLMLMKKYFDLENHNNVYRVSDLLWLNKQLKQ